LHHCTITCYGCEYVFQLETCITNCINHYVCPYHVSTIYFPWLYSFSRQPSRILL